MREGNIIRVRQAYTSGEPEMQLGGCEAKRINPKSVNDTLHLKLGGRTS